MYKVSKSCHGMQALEVECPTPRFHEFINCLVKADHINDERYKIRKACGAFLQCGYGEWKPNCFILVEFWSGYDNNIQAFFDYINNNFNEETYRTYDEQQEIYLEIERDLT